MIIGLMLTIASCAPRIAPSPDTSPDTPRDPVQKEDRLQTRPPEERPSAAEEATPRMMASLQLTQQAQSLIKTGQTDSAIRILERAIAIDPSNGQNYYYLSEAWLTGGNATQARHFNELAFIHLRSDEKWRQRVADQKQRIEATQAE